MRGKWFNDGISLSDEKASASMSLPTLEEMHKVVEDNANGSYVYEPIIVSPEQFADKELMAAIRWEHPKGRLTWRPRRRK